MPEHPLPARDAMTLARFIEEAAKASGGIEPLRRRLGVSRATIESMSVSDTPLVADDATALFEAFGLAPGGAAERSDQQGRHGAPGRR